MFSQAISSARIPPFAVSGFFSRRLEEGRVPQTLLLCTIRWSVRTRYFREQMRFDTAFQRFLVQAELDALPLIISQCDFELGDLLLDLGVAHVF